MHRSLCEHSAPEELLEPDECAAEEAAGQSALKFAAKRRIETMQIHFGYCYEPLSSRVSSRVSLVGFLIESL